MHSLALRDCIGQLPWHPTWRRFVSGTDFALGLTWTLGKIKLHGCGIHVGDSLVVSSGSGKDFAVARLKADKETLIGDFFTSLKATGKFTLVKKSDGTAEKSDKKEE